MAAFSCVRPVTLRGVQILFNSLPKNSSQALLPRQQTQNVLVRYMGGSGKHNMVIRPSRFIFHVARDFHHFYFLLGLIPAGIVIAFANVYIGRGKLTDIPDGYEPKIWEYYRRPIERVIAKYRTPVEKIYEKNLHIIQEESDKMKYRKLREAVYAHQRNNDKYRGWYYVPRGQNYEKILENKAKTQNDSVRKYQGF